MLVEIKCIKSRLRTLNKQAKIFFRIIPIYFLIWSSTKNLFHTLIWRQSSIWLDFVNLSIKPYPKLETEIRSLQWITLAKFNRKITAPALAHPWENVTSPSLREVSECRKIRTRKTPNRDTFHECMDRTHFDFAGPFMGRILYFV